jgi:hypothetical protein
VADRTTIICAGWRGPCPDAATAPRSALKPSSIRARQGEPWRCTRCSHAREGERRRGRNFWARKTHCPAGHEYSGANLIRYAPPGERPRRFCKACLDARRRAHDAKRRRAEAHERAKGRAA